MCRYHSVDGRLTERTIIKVPQCQLFDINMFNLVIVALYDLPLFSVMTIKCFAIGRAFNNIELLVNTVRSVNRAN